MNFNLSTRPEYNLIGACTTEVIDLYGVKCKLALVEKVNVSSIVSEWASIKTDGSKVFDVCIMPQTPDMFDTMDYQFNSFGFLPADNMTAYISAAVLDPITPFKKAIGNLIVLPSNKVMEITDVNPLTEHAGNLYAYGDRKLVYQLRLVPYEFKIHDNITDKHLIGELKVEDKEAEVIGELKTSLYKYKEKKVIPSRPEAELEAVTRENYKVLDNYLETLSKESKKHDLEVIDPEAPIYDTTEVDVFHKM